MCNENCVTPSRRLKSEVGPMTQSFTTSTRPKKTWKNCRSRRQTPCGTICHSRLSWQEVYSQTPHNPYPSEDMGYKRYFSGVK